LNNITQLTAVQKSFEIYYVSVRLTLAETVPLAGAGIHRERSTMLFTMDRTFPDPDPTGLLQVNPFSTAIVKNRIA
jgi:hypothetical protein